MRARVRRWLSSVLRFLCENGTDYRYTGNPAEPRWED